MIVNFTEEDLLSSKLVEPAWYTVLVTKVEDKSSKDNASINSWIKGKILRNADNGDETNAGVPTPFLWMVNSKGAWSAVGLLAAVGVEVKPGMGVDLAGLEGKTLDVWIENEVYNGVQQNKITGKYRVTKSA